MSVSSSAGYNPNIPGHPTHPLPPPPPSPLSYLRWGQHSTDYIPALARLAHKTGRRDQLFIPVKPSPIRACKNKRLHDHSISHQRELTLKSPAKINSTITSSFSPLSVGLCLSSLTLFYSTHLPLIQFVQNKNRVQKFWWLFTRHSFFATRP